MKVRRLRASEQDEFLDLLGLWPMIDTFAARDFFARYVTGDPDFDPNDVWVAEEDGAIRSCVQIFPRDLNVRGTPVPTGGIGSVFTHPGSRKGGCAAALMRAAAGDMQERGMLLGLLFAGPVAFYEKLGWHSWPLQRPLLRSSGDPAALESAEAFDPGRDLARIREIHAGYSSAREGTVVRNGSYWRTNLRVAGNPEEEILVFRRDGIVSAYLRSVKLSRFLVLSELGRDVDAAGDLAVLVAAALTPRSDDALAPIERPSPEFRSVASSSTFHDPELAAALERRGIVTAPVPDPTSMFLVVDTDALCDRTGVESISGESDVDCLRRVLPPERFVFWPADRF